MNNNEHTSYTLTYGWQINILLSALKARQHNTFITEIERSKIREMIWQLENVK